MVGRDEGLGDAIGLLKVVQMLVLFVWKRSPRGRVSLTILVFAVSRERESE